MNSKLKGKFIKGTRNKLRKLHYTNARNKKITTKGTQGIDNILGKTLL